MAIRTADGLERIAEVELLGHPQGSSFRGPRSGLGVFLGARTTRRSNSERAVHGEEPGSGRAGGSSSPRRAGGRLRRRRRGPRECPRRRRAPPRTFGPRENAKTQSKARPSGPDVDINEHWLPDEAQLAAGPGLSTEGLFQRRQPSPPLRGRNDRRRLFELLPGPELGAPSSCRTVRGPPVLRVPLIELGSRLRSLLGHPCQRASGFLTWHSPGRK